MITWEGFGTVPWRYVNQLELRAFLAERIEEGFAFPLNPKWILCDEGWLPIFEALLSSPHAQQAMQVANAIADAIADALMLQGPRLLSLLLLRLFSPLLPRALPPFGNCSAPLGKRACAGVVPEGVWLARTDSLHRLQLPTWL